MDPHIFAEPDPDPGSQNLVDPTDPDPKHWILESGIRNQIRIKINSRFVHFLDPENESALTIFLSFNLLDVLYIAFIINENYCV